MLKSYPFDVLVRSFDFLEIGELRLVDMEHSRRPFARVDRFLYVVVGCLSVVLAFRIGSALWSGKWDSLGALDFRLSLAWLFGTLCALRYKIRK
ncbi:MAG: hypothetical protein ABSH01_02710 [Terriglobia bacterium]|jgi:hypothetical protein